MILRSFAEKWGTLSFILCSPEVGVYGIFHKKLEKGKKKEEVWGGFFAHGGDKRNVTGVSLCYNDKRLDNLQAAFESFQVEKAADSRSSKKGSTQLLASVPQPKVACC